MLRTVWYFLIPMALVLVTGTVSADDWPHWGRTPARNMVTTEKNISHDFDPGKMKLGTDELDFGTTRNIKWVAKLGSITYGNPTVANGKVFIGTNNESPPDPKHKGDRGVVMCLDEKTGRLLWQLIVPKLGAQKESDWEYLGICSSPAVEGQRVYLVTNLGEVVCLDVEGLANGNDGPFKEEGKYMAGPGKPPMKPGPTDADIIWRYDMRDELGVFPHNITSSAVLIVRDKLFVNTSNGQDKSHKNIPSPSAPCLIALDKNSGQLIGEEYSGIGERIKHSNWSSPAYGEINGKGLVIFGAGDGICYGFDPMPIKGEDGLAILKEIWKFDCNPQEFNNKKYPDPRGPNEIISTPVFYKGRVYVGIGQDPEHGEGRGNLSCIDATSGKAVWSYQKINRTLSTVAIADDLVYAADYQGTLHCLDANSGKVYWTHDTGSHIWGSPLIADGKVYIGNENGILTILATGKEEKLPVSTIDFGTMIYTSPIVANGVLYLATNRHLYAIQEQDQK